MSTPDEQLGAGGRLAEGPAPELVATAFALEVAYGPLLYRGMSLADLAHTVALLDARVLDPALGAQLLAALLELHALPPEAFPFDPAHGDAYSNREHELRRRAPAAADWLPAGRARRESSTVGYTLVVRAGIIDITEALLGLLQALLDQAGAHVATLMPDYTYLQTAQPTTLAHYLLTFAQPIVRDLARLQLAFAHANRSPAGIGSTNGSRLPTGRARQAALLGFDGLALHTRDAMWQPDAPVETLSTLVAALVNADRLAEDLQIWATAEFGYIEPADRHSRISVIMPQKKNPYGLAYVRGVARDMLGRLVSAAAQQATPSGQVDNRIFAYGAVPQALAQATGALRLLGAIVAQMQVRPEVLLRRARQEHSGATDLAEAIVLACGLSPRVAHRVVGRAVRLAQAAERAIDAALLDEAARAVIERPLGLTDQFIAECMEPQHIVATRTTEGGAAPAAVQAMLAELATAHATARAWTRAQREQIVAAEQELVRLAEQLSRG